MSLGDQLPEDFTQIPLSTFRGRFTAPSFLKPRRRTYDFERLWAKREAVRAKTLTAIRQADFSRLKQLKFSHPVLGPFTLFEFATFLGKHEEWHVEQLKRIRANYED